VIKKIIFLTIIFVFISSINILGADNLIRLNEIKTEVKQAEENFNRNKIIKLKKEAAELVYNLETAKLFKEIFPDLEDQDNQAEFVVEKLAKSLNEDDLYKLMKIYPNNYRISNVHRAILAKSDSLEDLAKLLSAVPKNNYVFHPARSKAVKYVKDLKTARDFKQLFPNLDDYNKEARDIYRKLKNKLNREELIKLSEIFKSQSFNGLDDLLLKKSENIDDVLDTINRYPNFKRYSPDYVRKTAYNFVKDRTSAEKFLAEFTEDNQFTERAKEYLKESPSAKKETFNMQKEINKNSKIKDNSKLDNNNDYKEKNIVDKKLNDEKEKDGYAKMVELESDIISGKRSEITAKKEAVKYVDNFKTADKFHNVFYKNINNNDVDSIINNLKDDLNTTEIKKLITIFSDFPAVSTLIYEYLDRSKNLDQMIKAAKEFKDYKYQATAGRKALKYVNSLDSAVKYKYNFLFVIDEAHATGIFGEGRGIAHEEGVEKDVDMNMGTFSKALGGFGAYICADKNIVKYLINKGRSFIFTTSLPPSVIGGNVKSVEIVSQEHEKYGGRLLDNCRIFTNLLATLNIDHEKSNSQIFPFFFEDNNSALEAQKRLLDSGVYALLARRPSVTTPAGNKNII